MKIINKIAEFMIQIIGLIIIIVFYSMLLIIFLIIGILESIYVIFKKRGAK